MKYSCMYYILIITLSLHGSSDCYGMDTNKIDTNKDVFTCPQPTIQPNIAEDQALKDNALITACKTRDYAAVQTLLIQGASVNIQRRDGTTPLHQAAFTGNVPLLQLLLKAGAEVNTLTQMGTPLMNAIFSKNNAVVSILLDWGADATISDALGRTALTAAVKSENSVALILLLQKNIDIEYKDTFGNSALAFACKNDAVWAAKMLLDHHANVDSFNAVGETSLHLAVQKGNYSMVRLLVDYHANLSARNYHDATPLDIARTLCSRHSDYPLRASDPFNPMAFKIFMERKQIYAFLQQVAISREICHTPHQLIIQPAYPLMVIIPRLIPGQHAIMR